ncbi:hypothetical protein JTE90_015212 [Oedothorax gibbosus]|uniref:Uncharacterized protein n=1 Tax=Oedothorax gibbosus TaxID=931172 RepID=A0AAV6V907_9ARAC|nr:hypothetical protein JTE90_015212 [Oedothorax gibbosus]
MEARSDSLDVQINLLKGQTPNQQLFVANEDAALTSEVAIDRPGFIEVEKRTVIKKNCIINEKYVIPKFNGTAIPVDQGRQTLSFDASFVGSEFSIPDSQGSSAMEIASQGSSLGSVMEICSQESLMEYSSQETNTPTEPVNKTDSSTEVTCDTKFAKENKFLVHPDLPYIEENLYAEVSSTSNEPPVPEDDFPDYQYCDSYKEDEITRVLQEYGEEKDLENEAEFIKEEKSMTKVNDLKRRSSTERLLLAREKSVTAREAACISREKALKKREAAIANQKEILKDCVDNVIPLPKRLKLKKVFKYM